MSGAGKELRAKIRYQSWIDVKTRNGGAEGQHVYIWILSWFWDRKLETATCKQKKSERQIIKVCDLHWICLQGYLGFCFAWTIVIWISSLFAGLALYSYCLHFIHFRDTKLISALVCVCMCVCLSYTHIDTHTYTNNDIFQGKHWLN